MQMNSELFDKNTLVIDGTSYIGSGIVKAFLQAGATVIVPAASENKIVQLKRSLQGVAQEKLITFLTDTSDFCKVSDFSTMLVERFGGIDLAVTSLESPESNRFLMETEIQEWQALEDNLTAFFVASRALFMLMQDSGGMYLTISNADRLEKQAHSTLQQFNSIMQMQMAGLFANEKATIRTRYHHLYIGDGSEPNWHAPKQILIPPKAIGEYIIRLYKGSTGDPGKIFQFCMDESFKIEHYPAILKD